ncbi:MAG: ATP-binding protein [Gemmataceae bacterium]
MSYRALKRLLGETSLERKCRFLFGAFTLVLIALSFWFYALQTEGVAYEQARTSCRLLVNPIVVKHHLALLLHKTKPEMKQEDIARSWKLFDELGKCQYSLWSKNPPADVYERDLYKAFSRKDDPKNEAERLISGGKPRLIYYKAVRATQDCLKCHKEYEEGDYIDTVKIEMKTDAIVTAVHVNRAFLISIALATALLIMAGSWIIVRYVIVKPVKHLKDVSDAISAGELNVRSEIQTGDEFEDLSHAFNRMLRNLVSMQDRWRKVNVDLDRKVDELAQANLALYESNRLKGDFLTTMSHELRTPLNSILGFSEVLLSRYELNEKQQRWVRNIQTSGERLLALINDILDLAKTEAGKMELRIEEFSVHDVAEGMLTMFRQMAEKKNIDLRSQISSSLPVLRQDSSKLQHILQNLLSNAIKFTPEGGRVVLKAEAENRELVMTVSDTGVGIAKEEQGLVFEKFRQAGNPLTREQDGSGLGLSIVRELTKLLGGDVTLESELGRGSTFTVRLPLYLSEEPRLEFELTGEGLDLSHGQRIDGNKYGQFPMASHRTKLDAPTRTRLDLPNEP